MEVTASTTHDSKTSGVYVREKQHFRANVFDRLIAGTRQLDKIEAPLHDGMRNSVNLGETSLRTHTRGKASTSPTRLGRREFLDERANRKRQEYGGEE